VEDEYVWVGTQPDKEEGGKPGAGVNRYYRRTDSWNTYSKSDGLVDDKVTTIAVGSDDKILWLGTLAGLFKYDREQKKCQVVDIGEQSYPKSIRAICIKDDSLWLATTSGLLQVSKAGLLTEEYRAMHLREPFRVPCVFNIEFDGDYVWFNNWSVSSNGAIVRYNRKTKTWRRFTREDILRHKDVRIPELFRHISQEKVDDNLKFLNLF